MINNFEFILNPLIEQGPSTTSDILRVTANILIKHMNLARYDKIITEEDKGGILVAAISLISGLSFGIARWYPNNLANQIDIIFSREHITKVTFYLCGILPRDRVCIIDDMISTGRTIIGMIKAIRKLGAKIIDVIVIGEEIEYNGTKRVYKETGILVKNLLKISDSNQVSMVLDPTVPEEVNIKND